MFDYCEREPLAEDFCMVIHGEITVAAVLNRTRGRKGRLALLQFSGSGALVRSGAFRSLGLAVGGGAGLVVVRLGLVPFWCTTCTALSWWRGGGLREWGTTPGLFLGLRGGSVRCLSRLVFVDGFRWHCEDTMQSYYEAFQAGLDHDVMSQSGQSDSQGVPELEASWDWSPMSRDRSWWHSSHGRWSDEDWEWWQRVRSRPGGHRSRHPEEVGLTEEKMIGELNSQGKHCLRVIVGNREAILRWSLEMQLR